MKRSFFIFVLLLSLKTYGFHIVGGEMIYDYLGKNQDGDDLYKITLKIYRDCFGGGSQFDGLEGAPFANITIRDNIGNLIGGDDPSNRPGVYNIGIPVVTNIQPTINSECIQAPGTVCVEEGVYTFTVTLTPKTGGYYIIYQRCCRNSTILNVLQPDQQGSTYYCKIPGPEEAPGNSSARFKKFPPLFLCGSLGFNFDHSATDPDGDQLVYSFSTPLKGLDGCCASLFSTPSSGPSCPLPPPNCPTEGSQFPYQPLTFIAPYSQSYPIASNPSVTIDPITGKITGKPNLVGQFVVSICVKEFRNGNLINTLYRDFQFNIVPCVVSVVSNMADQLKKCEGNTVTFTNTSTSNIGALTYHWDFGVPNLTNDTSNVTNPTYTYQDTGKYYVTLIANPGKKCSDTLKKLIYVYPPLSILYQRPDSQCYRNNSFNFTTGGVYLPSATFDWNFTSSATPSTSTLKNPTGVTFNEAGWFHVKLTSYQFACKDTFVDSVKVIGRPKALINNLPSSFCDPAKVGFSNGSSCDLPLNYFWQFSNNNVSTAFEPMQVFSPAGVYGATLIVETIGVCQDTSMYSINNITVSPVPRATFTFTPKVTSIFESDIYINSPVTDNGVSCYYTFGDGTGINFNNVVHSYAEPGDYIISLVVTNSFGCRDSCADMVRILPEFRFWIPNCFTPDDNQLNDIFKPVVMGVKEYEFEIYDRWGQRIFRTVDPKDGWNGYFKDKECPQDIYTWKISYKNLVDNQSESKIGHLTLIRSPEEY